MLYERRMRKSASPAAVALDGLRGKRSGLELAINAEYYVPGMIELESDNLIWNWNGSEKRVTQFKGLLSGFVGLHSGSAECVLTFARRWGVLHPCPVHPPPQEGGLTAPDSVPSASFCLWRHPKGHAESIAEWRRISQQFDGTLRIAYDLAMDPPGRSDHWKLFYDAQEIRVVGETVDFDRRALVEHLNLTLFAGEVRPQIRWRNGNWGIDFHVGSLYGALAAQTTLIIAQRGIAICAGCGRFFPPKQLKPGQDAYCDGPYCGRKAAVRKAQRRRYQRKNTPNEVVHPTTAAPAESHSEAASRERPVL
jgi:hypothetical protein